MGVLENGAAARDVFGISIPRLNTLVLSFTSNSVSNGSSGNFSMM